MAGQPYWTTPTGSLGNFSEGDPLDLVLQAFPGPGSDDQVTSISIDGRITTVTLIRSGEGYTTVPAITVTNSSDDSGQGANIVVSTMKVVRAIANTTITGSVNYSFDDILTVVGGIGTSATLRVTGVDVAGRITGIEVINPGKYYTIPSNDSLQIETSLGTGLTAGNVNFTVTNPGSGYISLPTVTVDPPGASAVLGNVVLTAGRLTSIPVTTTGFGYATAPLVTISAPPTTYNKTVAVTATSSTMVQLNNVTDLYPYMTVTISSVLYTVMAVNTTNNTISLNLAVTVTSGTVLTLNNTYRANAAAISHLGNDSQGRPGAVVSIELTSTGAGYPSTGPVITIGSTATATSATFVPTSLGSGGVIATQNTTPGSNYNYPPQLTVGATPETNSSIDVRVTGGTGTGARFDLSLGVDTIMLIDGGFDYVTIPTIEFDDPALSSGTPALAGCMINRGSGYTTAPTVTLVNSNPTFPGSGATAIATVFNGAVIEIEIVDAGHGYTVPPTVIIGPPNNPNGDQAVAIANIGPTNMLYQLLSGSLPAGIATNPVRLTAAGAIVGIPAEVAVTTESEFTVRAIDALGQFRDRVFSIEINGPDVPRFLTDQGEIIFTPDSVWIDFQILILSPDPESYVVTVDQGILPPGLYMSTDGLIQGYPLPPIDEFLQPMVKQYIFYLRATKVGKPTQTATRQFSITVRNCDFVGTYQGNNFDTVIRRTPAILNSQPLSPIHLPTDAYYDYYVDTVTRNMGTFIHDNQFAYKFIGYDFDAAGGSIANDVVTGIRVTNGGINYPLPPVSPPIVSFFNSAGDFSGSGAQGRAVVNSAGRVASVQVTNSGSGYQQAPGIIIGGSIATIDIIQPGVGYLTAPTVSISVPDVASGVQAQFVAMITGNSVSSFLPIKRGTGYLFAPSITIGEPFANTIAWGNGVQANVNGIYYYRDLAAIPDPRTNYYQCTVAGTFNNTAPTFTSGGGGASTFGANITYVGTAAEADAVLALGSGATAVASISGIITANVANSGGANYSNNDVVVISAPDFPPGQQAEANLIVNGSGTILTVNVTVPGQGYTAAPTVVIGTEENPTSGTGANLVVNPSIVYSIDGLNAINTYLGIDNTADPLTFDPKTGWVTGKIPFIGNAVQTFELTVTVTKNTLVSKQYKFFMTIQGAVSNAINWNSQPLLGTLYNGEVSYFNVEATSLANLPLSYRLAPLNTQSLWDLTFYPITRTATTQNTITFNNNIVLIVPSELDQIKIGATVNTIDPGTGEITDTIPKPYPTVVEIDMELNTIRLSDQVTLPVSTLLQFTTNTYVTVGDNGIIQYAYNNTSSWFLADTDTVASFRGVTYFEQNLYFVACSDEGNRGRIYTSGDGVTWSPINFPFSAPFRAIVVGTPDISGDIQNRLVAVGRAGKVFYSDDNVSWFTASTGGVATDFTSITWKPATTGSSPTPGKFVAVTEDGLILTSQSGSAFSLATISWYQEVFNITPLSTPSTPVSFTVLRDTPYVLTLNDVACDASGNLLAVGTVRFTPLGATQSVVISSTDGGITWIPQPIWQSPPSYDDQTDSYSLFLMYRNLLSVAPNPTSDNTWIVGSVTGRFVVGTNTGFTPVNGDPRNQFTSGSWSNYQIEDLLDVLNIWTADPNRLDPLSDNPYVVNPSNILASGTIGLIVESVNARSAASWLAVNVQNLPHALTLLPSGNISGRVAFEVNSVMTPVGTTTQFAFVVQAYSPDNPAVSTTQLFYINVLQVWAEPFEAIYMKCMPSVADRALITQMQNFIDSQALYRPDDPYYGRPRALYYIQQYGVTPSSQLEYIAASDKNFSDRNLVLGPLQTAQATDANGNPLYEVVYTQIIDNLINPQGVSAVKQLVWPRPISLNLGPWFDSRTDIYTSAVFPVPSVEKRTSGVTNRTVIPLNNTAGIVIGQVVTGRGITAADGSLLSGGGQNGPGDPSVTVVNISRNTVTLDTPQTLAAGVALLFSTPTLYDSLTPGTAQILYPPSTPNMREQIRQALGQNTSSTILPRWMTSQQYEGSYIGSTLGYVAAAVICYTKPGYATAVKNAIETQWGHNLNEVDFSIDRYEVDKSATYNWDNEVIPPDWDVLPSSGVVSITDQSEDFYVLFPQKTILPNTPQY